jgi:glycosyltransferase involved in cell wall biosynthesis
MIGLMRVKNEARWIERCVESILPVCERVLVLDDHSTDGTPYLCSSIPGVNVFDSPFSGLDETRDKNYLLDKARGEEWVLMIDGDELLDPACLAEVHRAQQLPVNAFSFRVLYLWDSEHQVRTDGVYGRFRRPSMFRPGNHRFESTRAGGNFHCGNVPLALQPNAHPLDASLLHFGYMHKADRLRKYAWYNDRDPGNVMEDRYRHVAQGDVPEIPASARLMHAGPLQLEAR